MKVIISGSRDINDPELIEKAIKESGFEITECVCGMAPGVDMVSRDIMLARGVPVKECPAKWEDLSHPKAVIKTGRYGKYNAAAGPIRNKKMAEYAEALIAVWDGESKGTKGMIELAEEHGLEIHVYNLWENL